MSYYPETPAVVTGPLEESTAETALNAMPELLPDLQTNWASNADVKNLVLNDVIPVVSWCRMQRKELEEEWRAIRRMLVLQHDDGQKYRGRSNAYIPAYAKSLNTLVSAVSRGLFPSDEYMDVMNRSSDNPEAAKPVKDYLQYEFEKVARLRANIKPFLREFFNNGISVGKYWYEPREITKRKVGKLNIKHILGKAQAGASFENDYSLEGLRFSTRSIFNWYMYPVTAASMREAVLTAEDISVSRQFVDEMIRKGEWDKVDPGELAVQANSDYRLNTQELLMDMTGNSNQQGLDGNSIADTRLITEIWTRLVMPSAAYAEGEDTECAIPVKVVVSGTTILSVRRNPFWHQDFPYLVARMEVLAGSFYPKGSGHIARYLQYLVNDFVNQLNDNGNYALNPVVKVNPGTLAGPLPALKPGAVWPTTDPQGGIIFDRPPIEQLGPGLSLVNTFMTMLQDFTGTPPVVQGTSVKGSANTATGAQILQANARNPIQDLVEDLEQDVLTPLMYGAWMLGQQFRQGDVMDQIAGAPIKVSREQLFGDYMFRWLASSQAVNQQQRAQQAISLLQVVMPLAPYMQQIGKMIDPEPLLKKIYSDGFGFRGFDQFIKPIPVQPMMPGAPPGQDPNAPQGDGNVRSAAVQGGSQMPMQPGEGQDFANVRDNADQLAGMLGGGTGGGSF